MLRYIHGSEDSLDIDVHYAFNEMPSFNECQEFCSDKDENRNIIVVKDGIVVDCFKGTTDEINNGLIDTYHLHKQDQENIVMFKVKRDNLLKNIRVLRCLLSFCSRTQYRSIVKEALKSSSWKKKVETLKQIDFSSIEDFGKSRVKEDVYKTFAFQLGQAIGLAFGKEFYTKSSVANFYPKLEKYLYREKDADSEDLVKFINVFIELIDLLDVEEHENYVFFKKHMKAFDLRQEKYINLK